MKRSIVITLFVLGLIGFLLLVLMPRMASPHDIDKSVLKKLDKASWRLFRSEMRGPKSICTTWGRRHVVKDGKTYTRLWTAAHCVRNHRGVQDYVISHNGLNYMKVDVVAVGYPWNNVRKHYNNDRGHDWAVLETEDPLELPVLDVQPNQSKLIIGESLYTIGYPLGGDRYASGGIVANPTYSAPSKSWDGYIATDITALGGSSGSAVVNQDGDVIGILVLGARYGDNWTILTPIGKAADGMESGKYLVEKED